MGKEIVPYSIHVPLAIDVFPPGEYGWASRLRRAEEEGTSDTLEGPFESEEAATLHQQAKITRMLAQLITGSMTRPDLELAVQQVQPPGKRAGEEQGE